MSDLLAAYPIGVIKTIISSSGLRPWAGRLLLNGKVLSRNDVGDKLEIELELGHVIPDPFERWLVEKWLGDIRSPAFRESAQAEYLRAQWERSEG